MVNEARYRELKEKMAALKSLYASRHYSQCAKFGELLLSEQHDQTHPLQVAHLNFYTALSHDTLAREATLRNRWKGLNLAELHYDTAIRILTSPTSPVQCEPWSPNSSTSTVPSDYSRGRTDSIDSAYSTASSATSLGDSDTDTDTTNYASTSDVKLSPQHPSSRPQTPQQLYFSTNITSFLHMLEAHLADVRAQKRRTGVPTVRFCVPSPQTSPTRASRGSVVGGSVNGKGGEAMEAVRQARRSVVWRPRFDPEGVRRLCGDALAELEA